MLSLLLSLVWDQRMVVLQLSDSYSRASFSWDPLFWKLRTPGCRKSTPWPGARPNIRRRGGLSSAQASQPCGPLASRRWQLCMMLLAQGLSCCVLMPRDVLSLMLPFFHYLISFSFVSTSVSVQTGRSR